MSKLGIHFPNAGFRSLDALWSIPWDHFSVLHLNREWVPEIRLRYPQATILVRAYLENWATTEPIGWAHSIAEWAEELRPFNIELTFANEQNLAAEGHPLAARAGTEYPPPSVYHDILEWNVAVIRELRMLLPWATIHFPALSQGHSDDQPDAGYVGFEILREAVEMCDVLDAHIYWDESAAGQAEDRHYGERYSLLHTLFPNKTVFISECGTVASGPPREDTAITDWIEALPDYVAGACWFIWDSDFNNQHWILLNRPQRVEQLRRFGLSQATPRPVESIFSPVAMAEKLIIGTTPFNSTRYAPAGDSGQRIGFGHNIGPGEQLSDSLSVQDGQKLLREDLSKCLRELNRRVQSPLTVHQKSALVSLIYRHGISVLSPALIDALNASDVSGAADMINHAPNIEGENSTESLRRCEMESALFQKDSLPPYSQGLAEIPIRGTGTTPACFITSIANWVSIKQGQRFQIIGVWYYCDSIRGVAQEGSAQAAGSNRGQILAKVEDESGVGIPAELVVRRWDNPGGECEPQSTDAFGVVRFELGVGSEFDPQQGPGRDRIHVGDCLIAGLGVPAHQAAGSSQPMYIIRIRKME